jgi:hypothetical protein
LRHAKGKKTSICPHTIHPTLHWRRELVLWMTSMAHLTLDYMDMKTKKIIPTILSKYHLK